MHSLDALLEEAKWGQFTDKEIEYVVDQIKASDLAPFFSPLEIIRGSR